MGVEVPPERFLRHCDYRSRVREASQSIAQVEKELPPLLADNTIGGLVALVEHADDRTVLASDRSEAVVPVGRPADAAADHGQQLIVGREALAALDHARELRADHVPDVGPNLGAGPSQRPRVALGRDGRPRLVVEKA